MVVPELPQSIASLAWRSPANPLPSTHSASPSRPISTPNWRNARTVRELSSPPDKIEDPRAPLGDTAEDHRAVGDRLVARHGDVAVERFLDRFDPFHGQISRGSAREFRRRA